MYVNCLIVAQKELNNLLKFHSLLGFFSFPFSLPHSLSVPLSKPLSHLSFSLLPALGIASCVHAEKAAS